MGLSSTSKRDGGDNECWRVEHGDPLLKDNKGNRIPITSQTYAADGKTYTATGAYFEGAVNQKGGIIFAQYLENPFHAGKKNWHRDPKPDELPAIRAMSDVFWAHWFKKNGNLGNIRYFWVQGVANEQTQQILASALTRVKKDRYDHWPGVTFSTDSDEGKALLGE
jgi:hypothetical protein